MSSDEAVSQRLRAIEDRIARIESLLRMHAAPSSSPSTPPPDLAEPSPRRTPPQPPPLPSEMKPSPARRSEPSPQRDLERFFGLAVLGRVGAGALLLAAAYFGQLGWTRLGPIPRVLLIYVAGAALVAVGAVLRRRVMPRYTALLWGAGTALTYLAGTLACLHYELLPPGLAMASLFASAVLGQTLGRVLRLEAFATVALAGAYAAPVLVGTPSSTPTAFFALLVLLHSWAAWMQWRWSWFWARGFAVAATATLVAGWYAGNGIASVPSMLLHLELVLLCVTVPEWLRAFVRAALSRRRQGLLVAGLTTVQFVLLAVTWSHGECVWFGLAAGGVLLALGAALAVRTRELAPGVARPGSLLVAFGALQVWSTATGQPGVLLADRVGTLLVVALGLMVLRGWILVGELGAMLATSLAAGVLLVGWPAHADRRQVALLVFAALALVRFARPPAPPFALGLGCAVALFGLCHEFSFVGAEAHWLPIALSVTSGVAVLGVLQAGLVRDRTLLGTAVVLLAGSCATWAWQALGSLQVPSDTASLSVVTNLRFLSSLGLLAIVALGHRVVPVTEKESRVVLAVAALAIAYITGLLEVMTAVEGLASGWSRVATSLYTLVFAGALLAVGFAWRRTALRWTGLIGFAVAALKVTVFDLANVDTPLRVLAAGGLGGVLLLAAYAYARNRSRAAGE